VRRRARLRMRRAGSVATSSVSSGRAGVEAAALTTRSAPLRHRRVTGPH
jgi:hypothetical protein